MECQFPNPFSTFATTTSTILEAGLSSVVPFPCLMGVNHYANVLVVTLVPLGLVGPCLAGAALMRHHPELSNQLVSAALLISFVTLPSTSIALFRTFQASGLSSLSSLSLYLK